MNRAALVITPHPVSLDGQRVYMPADAPLRNGETLVEYLGRFEVYPGQQWAVEVDGIAVTESNWPRLRPKPGRIIECRRVAQKDVLRIVALAALAYFTLGTGVAGVGGGLGTGGVFAAGGAIGGGFWAAGCADLDGAYW